MGVDALLSSVSCVCLTLCVALSVNQRIHMDPFGQSEEGAASRRLSNASRVEPPAGTKATSGSR
jgi:hypothetical protein